MDGAHTRSIPRLSAVALAVMLCGSGSVPAQTTDNLASQRLGNLPGTSAVLSGGGQPPTNRSADPLAALLARPGDVSFRKTPLAEAVFSLSEVWGINIVAGGDVQGEITGVFAQSPLSEVLDAILGANGYGYRRSGNSLIILPLEQIGTSDPSMVSRTLRLTSTTDDQGELIEAARMLLSPRGRIQPIPARQTVLVIDHAENVERVLRFLEGVDTSTTTPAPSEPSTPQPRASAANNIPKFANYSPQFIDATALQTALVDTLDEETKVILLADDHRLMVRGTPAQLELPHQVVQMLDQPRPQVRIAALIYDVELREGEELGIDWGQTLSMQGSFGGNAATTGAGTGTTTNTTATAGDATATAVATGVAITLGTLQDTLTLGNVIRVLDETRGAHLLADPTITVADRSEATIKIVTKIPYQQLTQTQQGGNIGTTAFEEAGITLTVNPIIADDGTISMQVRPEFSTLVEYVNGQPLIDSRAAETNVRVADLHTLVIGGLRRKQMRDAISGIPGLMHINKLGRLFGAHASEVTESELLVFLRPEIVTPYQGLGPRGTAAATVSGNHLDRIPVADPCPLIDCCQDKHCVYHHPRPRVNRGAPAVVQFPDTMYADSGLIGGAGLAQEVPLSPPTARNHHEHSQWQPATPDPRGQRHVNIQQTTPPRL